MKRLLLPTLALLLLAACGSKEDRPAVVAAWPQPGDMLPYLVREIRVVYDRPVAPLNTNSVALAVDDITVAVRSVFSEDDPRIVTFYPVDGATIPAGLVRFTLSPGFEVDEEGRYRLQNYVYEFHHGVGLPVFLAVPSPASVVWSEAESFQELGSLATPGGRAPIGLVGTATSATQRMWVQLASGDGAGRSLAYFVPGDAGMTELTLTTQAGGDLVTTAPALGVSPDGRTLYVAWRDTAAGRVRVHAVDARTGFELDTAVLSPEAGKDTRPLGLLVSTSGEWIDITCAAPGVDRLVRLDAETLDEEDLGPDAGVDGLPLVESGGPVAPRGAERVVAPRLATTADLTIVRVEGPVVEEAESEIVGVPGTLLATPDEVWIIEGLRSYVAENALAVRPGGALNLDAEVAVSSDVDGVNPAATAVRGLASWPGLSRVLVLLDNDTAAVMTVTGSGWFQEDFDPVREGTQAADLSSTAPGATYAAFPAASFAPDP